MATKVKMSGSEKNRVNRKYTIQTLEVNNGKEMYKKVCSTRKVVFLITRKKVCCMCKVAFFLIRSVVFFLPFSLILPCLFILDLIFSLRKL